MNTTRTARLQSELAAFTAEQLDTPMHDLKVVSGWNVEEIDSLINDAGYASSQAYLNDHNVWSQSLRDVIGFLVDSIYTIDGVTFETIEELEASKAE